MNIQQLKELAESVDFWGTTTGFSPEKLCGILDFAVASAERLETADSLNKHLELAIRKAEGVSETLRRKLETAELERDELRAEQAEHDEQIARMEGKFGLAKRALDSKAARCDKVEAELRRRDAAAGEPVYQVGTDGQWYDCKEYIYQEAKERSDVCRILYTTAPPVVLPPKYADELTERAELIEAYSKTQCEIAQELGCDSDNESILKAIYELKALGAQPQKVVELPDQNFRECVNGLLEEAIAYAGTQQLRARLSSRLSNFVKPQHAANVKWEVKK